MFIAIINGPNLNLLGRRSPEIYGCETFEDTLAQLKSRFADLELQYFQSNSEGALIDALHHWGYDPQCVGIVINPGAYAHYSYAIADAIEAVPVKVGEVHISNIHAREEFRHKSVTAQAADFIIAGAARDGYALAISHLIQLKNDFRRDRKLH